MSRHPEPCESEGARERPSGCGSTGAGAVAPMRGASNAREGWDRVLSLEAEVFMPDLPRALTVIPSISDETCRFGKTELDSIGSPEVAAGKGGAPKSGTRSWSVSSDRA
jgi:hypothetical protein